MRKHKFTAILAIAAVLIAAVFLTLRCLEPEYAYMPPKEKVISKENRTNGYDMWGTFVSNKDADRLRVSSQKGAVKVDDRLHHLGRDVFYKETFGNEVFLTDILGLLDGPITVTNMTKAIAALKGKGTTNLRVELAKTVKIGGKTFKKGEMIDTGIDVPKGAFAPLGMPFKYSDGKIKAGIRRGLPRDDTSEDDAGDGRGDKSGFEHRIVAGPCDKFGRLFYTFRNQKHQTVHQRQQPCDYCGKRQERAPSRSG